MTMSGKTVRQYMAMAEGAIGATFVNHGLYIHHEQGIQGPHTLLFGLRLYQATAANLARALRLGPAVEAAIGDSPARVYSERGLLFVEIPSPWPATILGRSLHGQGLVVPLGLTAHSTIAGIDFETNP